MLLAICVGNSPVIGEFPAQRPVTRSFGVFFDLRPNQRLSKPCEAGDLRRHRVHYDIIVMFPGVTNQAQVWYRDQSFRVWVQPMRDDLTL